MCGEGCLLTHEAEADTANFFSCELDHGGGFNVRYQASSSKLYKLRLRFYETTQSAMSLDCWKRGIDDHQVDRRDIYTRALPLQFPLRSLSRS